MAGLVLLLMSYLLSQFYRSFLAVLSQILGRDLSMSATELSYASAAWFIVFALAQFPIGHWLDKFGPRRTASMLLLIGGAGGIGLFAVATAGWQIIVAMGLIGLGCAPVLMGALFLFAHNFDAAKFATMTSLFVGIGTLGNVLGSEPLAIAVEAYGWRSVGGFLCLVTALVAAGIFFLVVDPETDREEASRGRLSDLLRIRELWLVFPMIFTGYALAAGIRGLWAGPYLGDMYGLATEEIGRVTLYMALALAVGSLVYGPLDRVFNTRKWLNFGGNLIVLAAILWLWLAPEKAVWQISLAFVAIGFFGAGYSVQIAHGKGFVPRHLTGRGVTLLNFFSIGGAGAMQALSGLVVGSAAATGGPGAGYDALFMFYTLTLAAALAVYLFSRDAKPRPA